MKEYEFNGSIPRWLKLIMAFIDRVGFPVLAFILMYWMAINSIDKMNCSQEKIVILLTEWQATTIEFRKATISRMDSMSLEHQHIMNNQNRIVDKIKS